MAEPTSFVALNIGSQRVSMAVFSATSQGGLLIKNYSSTELLGDPAADAARMAQVEASVKELVGGLNLKKESVRYAISGQSVFTRFVKLPPLTEEKVADIVEFEAQQNVPFGARAEIRSVDSVGQLPCLRRLEIARCTIGEIAHGLRMVHARCVDPIVQLAGVPHSVGCEHPQGSERGESHPLVRVVRGEHQGVDGTHFTEEGERDRRSHSLGGLVVTEVE